MTKTGWKNKGGTSSRPSCECGSWKQHWIKVSGKEWPAKCSVAGCENVAELGAHLFNPSAEGEKIAPFCKGCNNAQDTSFTLKNIELLVSANRSETCEKNKGIIDAVSRKY